MDKQTIGAVRFLLGENKGRYPHCNSLYVEGAGILIDPASNRERLIRLRAERDVKAVWLSHWHEDHFMQLDLFDDLPLWISPVDAPPLADMETFLQWYGFTEEERTSGDRSWSTSFISGRRPAGHLVGGERITVGPVTIDLIATPGHTPGHLAFYFPECTLLFAGDYDLTRFGPWYGDLYSSIEQTRSSIDLLREMPVSVVSTAHETGLFFEPSETLWRSYDQIIGDREAKLLEVLEQPATLEAIVGSWIVYGKPREPKAFFAFGERVHMEKHLADLERRGMVVKDGERYRKV